MLRYLQVFERCARNDPTILSSKILCFGFFNYGCKKMHCRFILLASQTDLCFALGPQHSCTFQVSLQNISFSLLPQYNTATASEIEPTIVPVIATVPIIFGTLSRMLLKSKVPCVRLLTLFKAIFSHSFSTVQVRTNTYGKRPPPPARIDVPGFLLYMTILGYGIPVDSGLKEEVISYLAIVIFELNQGGDLGDILSTKKFESGIISLQYSCRRSGLRIVVNGLK